MAIKKKTAVLVGGIAAVALLAGGITAAVLAGGGNSSAKAADAAKSAASTSDKVVFNLGPKQDRVRLDQVPEAIAAIKQGGFTPIEAGKLTVVVSPYVAPLGLFADDDTTLIGNETDIAQLIADGLGLELNLQPAAWADWPLGIQSGKYDLITSNVTVTEERKNLYDFASYRDDLLGFYVKSDSKIKSIKEAKDVAGLKVSSSDPAPTRRRSCRPGTRRTSRRASTRSSTSTSTMTRRRPSPCSPVGPTRPSGRTRPRPTRPPRTAKRVSLAL
jgi:polar amino acid transport system substrate-binding protein